MLEQALIVIGSIIGGGGVVRLYDLWSTKRKTDHDHLQEEREWISNQNQMLFQRSEDEKAELRGEVAKLKRNLDKLEVRFNDAVAEIYKLGGQWPTD